MCRVCDISHRKVDASHDIDWEGAIGRRAWM